MAETLSNVELLMCAPQKGENPPTVGAMKRSLAERGFPEDLAGEIPVTTAFRRAVQAVKAAYEQAAEDGTKLTIKATCAEGKDRKTFGQIEQVIADENGISRKKIAVWTMTVSEDGQPELSGPDLDRLNLSYHRSTYTWADLTGIAREAMKKHLAGSYSPRPNGGVWFVPIPSREQIDRLDRAFSNVGFNLLRYAVPDTNAQKEEIARSIHDHFATELDEHRAAIEAYLPETRPGVMANRREAIAATAQAIQRVAHLLNGRLQDLSAKTAACFEALNAKLAAAQQQQAAAAPVASQPTGGRRILSATA